MITFSKLEKKGNLGNQLFQIASTIGIAERNRQPYAFPAWSYNRFFKNALPILQQTAFEHYPEQNYHHYPIDLDAADYDLEGWFQSEKYFDSSEIREVFAFDEDFITRLRGENKELFAKATILISIRRGDFVNHKDYFQLPIHYYINALLDHFSDWESHNLLVLSDDPAYCRFHFSFLDNAFFASGLSAIGQLALASLCDHFIISNSTFSWWCAWLGEKPHSKIIRPLHNFTDSKRAESDDRDYFPDRWITYNHLGKKIKLPDTVFAIKTSNAVREGYLKSYFDFGHEVITEQQLAAAMPESRHIIYTADYMLPPLLLLVMHQILEKKQTDTHFFLLGKPTPISAYLDVPVLKKQYDFGIFARLMPRAPQPSHKLAVVGKSRFSAENTGWGQSHSVPNGNYTMAGIVTATACRYFYLTTRHKMLKSVKTKVKKLLKTIKS